MTEQLKEFIEMNSDLIEEEHSALYFICPTHMKHELFTIFNTAGIEFRPSIRYIALDHILHRYMEMKKLFKEEA